MKNLVLTLAFLVLSGAAAIAAIKAGTPKPIIVEDPIGRTVSLGAPLALSVTVSNQTGVTFQWLTNSVAIPGATNAVLSIDPVSTDNSGAYVAVASSTGGSITSAVASVTVTQFTLLPPTALGSTGALLRIVGQVGDVYRIEVSLDFGPFLTNGYATNFSGVARYLYSNAGSAFFRNFRAAYERLLPVMYPPDRTNAAPVVRAYGKLNEAWKIEGSSDLNSWSSLGTVTNLAGWVKFTNAPAPVDKRFYRISLP